MNKNIKSLQDVIKLWISKGAIMNKRNIDGFGIYPNYLVQLHSGNSIIERVSIYEILYSPESNFFEVLGKCKWCWECDTKRSLKDAKCNVCGGKLEEHNDSIYIKTRCVTSPDPLQYLLDNLNETTS